MAKAMHHKLRQLAQRPRGGIEMNWISAIRTFAFSVGLAIVGPTVVMSQQAAPSGEKELPYVVLRADEATYDKNTGIVTARGKVEISHGAEVLHADTVTYDKRKDTITAIGNVVLLEPTGDVIFSDKATFSDGMREGIAEGFRMLMTDNTRLAGVGGTRTGGLITTINKGVFSPCSLCKDKHKWPPLWRIRSRQVIHDNESKQIEHKDSFLEFYGIPVIYTPYLSHPDPSVKRRSGFLTPSFSNNATFGNVLLTPYFWAIAPNEDLLITPRWMTQESPVLSATYRRRFAKGELEVDGSITNPERQDTNGNGIGGNKVREHFFAKGKYHHNSIWRTRFQVQHASDDTYLRRYQFPEPDRQTLTTSFTTEGFKGRNYANVSGYSFQGLREEDDPGESPLVLPFAEYNYVSNPTTTGAFFTADTNALIITRDEGVDSRRLSFKGGWHLPYTAWTGEMYRLSALVQTDLYSANDVTTESGAVESAVTGRVFPQLMAEWRYPFARAEANAVQVIEPIAAVIVAPNGGNDDKIPNEDSQDVEFDSTNLFAPNRFSGVDRVDGGHRFIYGINWSLYGNHGGAIETFLGQSQRLRTQTAFTSSSGLRDKTSDVVGKLRLSPGDWLDFLYRFRFDPDTTSARRNQVDLSIGPSWLKFGTNYLFLDESSDAGTFGDREEVTLSFNARLSNRWIANGSTKKNLISGGGTVNESIGLTYTDECFTFIVRGTRNFTEDRDLKPTNTLFFQLIFKHLGTFASAG
jgi:LPS-assembly protein